MVETQLGRRNLSPLQRVQIAEKYRPVFKKKAEEKQLSSLKQNSTVLPKSDQTDEKIHTRDELAKIAKVGHDTYGKAKKIIDLDTNNIKMIDTQLGRRNITLEQKSYLRGLQYEREKKNKENIKVINILKWKKEKIPTFQLHQKD